MDLFRAMTAAAMKELDLKMKPENVAAGLHHLGGLAFFDSSGNFPDSSGEIISIVAARPERVIDGSVKDMSEVNKALEKSASEGGDLPNGGLCGWVQYDGAFRFGVYPEMLVYRHSNQTWYETGSLSGEITHSDGFEGLDIGEFSQEMSEESYVSKVAQVKEYIAAGDIYQVNLSQKFTAKVSGANTYGLYQSLRECAPAPLASYFDLGGTEVLSSSPETFLRFENSRVETRPIKGTRPRFDDPAQDQRSAYELRTSEKEVSELVMITDLQRNDIGQVCDFGSVQVESMLKLEKFEHVYHLVSTVTGNLKDNVTQLEALQACFPGGSITGAPKKRAMEIISELETAERGVYTGTMGYLGFNGQSQFNIAIRTMVREGDELHYHVGAGIVADSDADAEYQETLQKAKGLRLAVSAYQQGC